jgi:CDP-diacylglycerol---serine O-phosphatidyltransferase
MVRRQRRHNRNQARIHRSLSIVPSLFTIGNIFCGYYSLTSTLHGEWDRAAILIGIGYILDGLDGRIARLTKTASEFGVQLDSIADVVTFGAAPGFLAFSWGFSAGGGSGTTVAMHDNFGFLATFAFVVCGALRLARFNVQTKKPPESSSKRYFVGLPIPAAAGMIAAVVHFLKKPALMNGAASFWWGVLIVFLAFLMISTVRYSSFKEFDVKKAKPSLALAATAMLIGLVFFYSEEMLLAMATIYVSSGPIAKVIQIIRRFFPGSVAAPSESAHGNIKS